MTPKEVYTELEIATDRLKELNFETAANALEILLGKTKPVEPHYSNNIHGLVSLLLAICSKIHEQFIIKPVHLEVNDSLCITYNLHYNGINTTSVTTGEEYKRIIRELQEEYNTVRRERNVLLEEIGALRAQTTI